MSVVNNAALAGAKKGQIAYDQYMQAKKYKFVSADKMYASIREHVFAAGLSIYQNEVSFASFEKKGYKGQELWAKITYEFALIYDQSVEACNRECVTIVVRLFDAQSCAAARTLALKAWLRGKFLLPTGETDEEPEGRLPQHTVTHVQSSKKDPAGFRFDGMKLVPTGDFGGKDAFSRVLLTYVQRVHREKCGGGDVVGSRTFVTFVNANLAHVQAANKDVQESIYDMMEREEANIKQGYAELSAESNPLFES